MLLFDLLLHINIHGHLVQLLGYLFELSINIFNGVSANLVIVSDLLSSDKEVQLLALSVKLLPAKVHEAILWCLDCYLTVAFALNLLEYLGSLCSSESNLVLIDARDHVGHFEWEGSFSHEAEAVWLALL